MYKNLFLLLFLLLNNITFSQNYLLVDNYKELSIIEFNSQRKIKLTDIFEYNLLGYNWDNDTLLVFLKNVINNKIEIKKFSNINIFDSIVNYKNLKTNSLKPKYYYTKNTNNDLIYISDKIRIVIKAYELFCYFDNVLLWGKTSNIWSFGIATINLGYQNPVISPDKKTILFQYNTYFNSKVVEIDVNTGEEKKIVRKAKDYSFSPDSKFILFFKKNKYYLYNKKNKDIIDIKFDRSWYNAQWLYK